MKFWYAGVFGGFGAFGMSSVSIGSSVSGSIRRICGGNGIEGQLVRIRPWESNVIEPQRDDG